MKLPVAAALPEGAGSGQEDIDRADSIRRVRYRSLRHEFDPGILRVCVHLDPTDIPPAVGDQRPAACSTPVQFLHVDFGSPVRPAAPGSLYLGLPTSIQAKLRRVVAAQPDAHLREAVPSALELVGSLAPHRQVDRLGTGAGASTHTVRRKIDPHRLPRQVGGHAGDRPVTKRDGRRSGGPLAAEPID